MLADGRLRATFVPEHLSVKVSEPSKLRSTSWANGAFWPAECRLHHPWKPGTVTITWEPCDCPPARAARDGHVKVKCNAPRCEETWWSPLQPARAAPSRPPGRSLPLTTQDHGAISRPLTPVNRGLQRSRADSRTARSDQPTTWFCQIPKLIVRSRSARCDSVPHSCHSKTKPRRTHGHSRAARTVDDLRTRWLQQVVKCPPKQRATRRGRISCHDDGRMPTAINPPRIGSQRPSSASLALWAPYPELYRNQP